MESNNLKRVIIKEELVALTGNFKEAIVLNQLLYWSKRTKDTKKFLKEEKERIKKYGNCQTEDEKAALLNDALKKGWIYKKAKELSKDCLMGLSDSTISKLVESLEKKGWINIRNNPFNPWDHTKQYRVNLLKIEQDLNKLGYSLEDYDLAIPEDNNSDSENSNSNKKDDNSKNKNSDSNHENTNHEKNNTDKKNNNILSENTSEGTPKSTISESRVRDKDDLSENPPSSSLVLLIEDDTHLTLTNKQVEKVSKWNEDILIIAIELFNKCKGKTFKYLETVYKDKLNNPKSTQPQQDSQNDKEFGLLKDTKPVTDSGFIAFMKSQMKEIPFKTWILTIFKKETDENIVFEYKNNFTKNIIQKRYKELIDNYCNLSNKQLIEA